MLALNLPVGLEGKDLRDAWSQKAAFYNMFPPPPLVFLLLKLNPFALCRESFASQGRWERCRREGGLFCVSPALVVSREGVDRVFLSPPLSFSVSITMEFTHSQWKHAWAQDAKTKGTQSITHYIIPWTCTPITVMSVRERLSGTRYQGDYNDEMH